MNNLAVLYMEWGAPAKSEPMMLRVLAYCQKRLGPQHPMTAGCLENLASLQIELGRPAKALEYGRENARAELQTVAEILSFTSEKQRLAFQETFFPYSLFGTLGSGPDLALAVLRYKGIVLDSLVEDLRLAQSSQDEAVRRQVLELRQAAGQLMQLTLEPPAGQSAEQRQAERARLDAVIERGQGELARRTAGLGRPRRALSVTVEQVQQALPEGATLVELLHYMHSLPGDKAELRYGAIVIPRQGAPRWVPLLTADKLEPLIKQYQARVRGEAPARATRITPAAPVAGATEALLRELYTAVWAPIAKTLPAGTTTVILSPDGELNFLSFATLLTPEDHFVGQDYRLVYVASGRDLLASPPASANPRLVTFANPDYGTTLVAAAATDRAVGSGLEGVAFAPLPGTAREAQQLGELARRDGIPFEEYREAQATEGKLRQVQSPRILHLATHGFFLDPPKPGEQGVRNPMQRSGIALAGAQTTVDAWRRGQAPPAEADGILMAQEVGALDLSKTTLVSLSACDTGSGEARAGEGVLGLRRGFVEAGAQNLLMTLWPVADQETAAFMTDFYQAMAKSGSPPFALAEVQRAWLTRLRSERGVAAAVSLAGPFVLTFQGPLR